MMETITQCAGGYSAEDNERKKKRGSILPLNSCVSGPPSVHKSDKAQDPFLASPVFLRFGDS